MIFTYWEGEVSELRKFVAEWSLIDSNVRVYSRHDVTKSIENIFDLSLFDRLRIPSARADIARFALLEEHGGFYVAPDTVPGSPAAVLALLDHLKSFEYVTFVSDNSGHGRLTVLDFAVLSRKDSNLPHLILNSIFYNLRRHDRLEARSTEHVDYRLENMTGWFNVARRIFVETPTGFETNPRNRRKLRVESVSDTAGHPAFSAIRTLTDRCSEDKIGTPQRSEPLFLHPRWEDDKIRQIFDRVNPPCTPDAQALWHETRQQIVMTGPVEESDIELLNRIAVAAEMLTLTRATRFPSTHSDHDIAVKIGYWEGVFESNIDEYLMELKERSL